MPDLARWMPRTRAVRRIVPSLARARWRPVIALGTGRLALVPVARILARRLAATRTVLRLRERTTERRLLTRWTTREVAQSTAVPGPVTATHRHTLLRLTVPMRIVFSTIRTAATERSTVDRRQVARNHTERTIRERTAGLRTVQRETVHRTTTTAVAPERKRPPLVVALPARLPHATTPPKPQTTTPPHTAVPDTVHMGQSQRREPATPAPNLDELVDRVLRRIERRAVAQRERLGRS